MEYRPLGQTDLQVSALCLGTMTYGEQNTEAEAHAQLDRALDRGINFIDTAEMYPVPPRAETQGLTEQYIGTWLAKEPSRRERIVLATKVSGPAGFDYLRRGPRLNREQVQAALDASLKRLQTDVIDLYQVHWPERKANYFGRLGYTPPDPETDAEAVPLLETLAVLGDAVRAGKVRHIGVSNETPWGVMEYLRLAERYDLPRVVSIQNPYNLLNRSFEIGLAEIAHREAVGLLAYSPLAFGMLSGKYRHGASPAGARLTLFERFKRYTNTQGQEATEAYAEVAERHGVSLTQLALQFVTTRPFVTSNIIGATTLEQLDEDIESLGCPLSEALLEAIEAVHRQFSIPCP